MNVNFIYSAALKLLTCLLVVGLAACGPHKVRYASPAPPVKPQAEQIEWNRLPAPPAKRQLAAVAGFENRSTYSADRLWDTAGRFLTDHLIRAGYFRVVEWEKMKRLFDWDTLIRADIAESPEAVRKAGRVLQCEYFVSGVITRFNVQTHPKIKARVKSGAIDTTVSVELLLQDAITGERLATGRGEHTIRQPFPRGQTVSWDSGAGEDALDMAAGKALVELISTFNGTRHRTRTEPWSR